MPSKKTAPAKKAAPAAAPAEPPADPEAADPEAADPEAADPEAADPEAVDPEAADPQATEPAEGEERPLNRAERRAKGKSTTVAQPTFRGKVVGGHGPAHTQRMWSNRRSGG